MQIIKTGQRPNSTEAGILNEEFFDFCERISEGEYQAEPADLSQAVAYIICNWEESLKRLVEKAVVSPEEAFWGEQPVCCCPWIFEAIKTSFPKIANSCFFKDGFGEKVEIRPQTFSTIADVSQFLMNSELIKKINPDSMSRSRSFFLNLSGFEEARLRVPLVENIVAEKKLFSKQQGEQEFREGLSFLTTNGLPIDKKNKMKVLAFIIARNQKAIARKMIKKEIDREEVAFFRNIFVQKSLEVFFKEQSAKSCFPSNLISEVLGKLYANFYSIGLVERKILPGRSGYAYYFSKKFFENSLEDSLKILFDLSGKERVVCVADGAEIVFHFKEQFKIISGANEVIISSDGEISVG